MKSLFFSFLILIGLNAFSQQPLFFPLEKYAHEDERSVREAFKNRDFIFDKMKELNENSKGYCASSNGENQMKWRSCDIAICKIQDFYYKGPAYLYTSDQFRIGINKNKREVEGIILWNDGIFFSGIINEGIPTQGILVYNSQKYYIGFVRGKKAHGKGKLFDGTSYKKGEWVDGILLDDDGTTYPSINCTESMAEVAKERRLEQEAKVAKAKAEAEIAISKENLAKEEAEKSKNFLKIAETNASIIKEKAIILQDSIKQANRIASELLSCGFKNEVELLLTGAYFEADYSQQMKHLLTNRRLSTQLSDFFLLFETDFARRKSTSYRTKLRKHIDQISFNDITNNEPQIECLTLNNYLATVNGFPLPYKNKNIKIVKISYAKVDGDKYELFFLKNPKTDRIIIIQLFLLN